MDLHKNIYEPINELKQRFYECPTNDEWQKLKGELKDLLAIAKDNMDAKFYQKYADGVIKSITKIYGYKQKQFNKADKKPFTPKVTYLVQPELADALIKFLNVRTQVLQNQLNNEANEISK
jgi:hypothetical protein